MCIFMMFSGVIAFSFSSGVLTNAIQQMEEQSAIFEEKIGVLDRLQAEHKLPMQLYSQIKKNLRSNFIKDAQSISDFVELLPINLKQKVTLVIYEPVYTQVDYLRGKSKHFLAWICPLLRTQFASQGEYVYYEGEVINHIYFLKNGTCGYVLPKYTN